MSRKDLGLSEKIAILDSIQAEPNRSSRRLAEITGISKSSILRILRDEKRLRTLWASENRRDVKRYRESKCPEVDEALRKWYSDIGSRNESLSGSVLMKKAEQLALELGRNDFRATDGWLSRWKQRHCIKFKRTPADVSTANQWRALRLPEILQSFSAEDIYNAAETSLFHSQERSFASSLDLPSTPEKSKDRLTVLCCTNMSGSDKRQLLIIGHSVEPICINEFKLENFQFSFHANNNARMTTPIFSSWLSAWDEELQRARRRVLLLIDDCVPRPPTDSLKNIVFEFLPTNITTKIQPLSMGIIDNLKTLFNAKMADSVFQGIDPNFLMPSPELNLMQAALIAADSWKNVSQNLIRDCFTQSGLKGELARERAPSLDELPSDPLTDHIPTPISAGNSQDPPASRESLIPHSDEPKSEGASVDGESSTAQAQSSDPDSNPVPSLITSGNSEESAPCESWIPKTKPAECFEFVLDAGAFLDREPSISRSGDDSDSGPVRAEVSKIEALECLERVKRYFAQLGRKGCPEAELEACMRFVVEQDRSYS